VRRQGADKVATIKDVAAYILDEAGPMTAMKLQKLCYYSQAWSLVWDEAPLFDEEFQAWANGPVAPDLYSLHRGQLTLRRLGAGDPRALTHDQRETIDAVIGAYDKLTARQLSDLSHREDPWLEAREGLQPTERGRRSISQESMYRFYNSLSEADDTVTV
jgi:uncharacterized phage-associated protein